MRRPLVVLVIVLASVLIGTGVRGWHKRKRERMRAERERLRALYQKKAKVVERLEKFDAVHDQRNRYGPARLGLVYEIDRLAEEIEKGGG